MHGMGSRDLSACKHCGLEPLLVNGEVGTYRDVDPCLGIIPGVTQACCGHGGHNSLQYAVPGRRRAELKAAYVVISLVDPPDPPGTFASDGGPFRILRGRRALAWFRERGCGPPQ